MNAKRIDGTLFAQMLQSGLNSLVNAERELNALNVFPVADGDTGTNMRLTLQNGMRMAGANAKLCLYLRELSGGMLLSARGNSGVILSQLFKGLYLELARCSAATTEDMRNALIRAYQVAYAAVINPVEGTMLTVAREGIENIKSFITRSLPLDRLFIMYLAEMSRVLERTPEMLPVLKESGVVDSGGKGWITLIGGMLQALTGEKLPSFLAPAPEAAPAPDFSRFTEDSRFEDGYCTEFILQMLKDPAYRQDFDLKAFTEALGALGTSLAVVRQDSRVKVHIHAKDPAPIIGLARRYGEFLTFKLENMQVQHNQRDAETAPQPAPSEPEPLAWGRGEAQAPKPSALALVAVACGEGLRETFLGQGCADVLDGGPTMSVSASEFLEAAERIPADHIVFLPDSANVILAAEQAAGLWKRKDREIHVIPTRSVAEGYFALAMDDPEDPDPMHRIARIAEGARGVVTVTVARAARTFTHAGKEWAQGERVAFVNGEPAAAGEDLTALLAEALRSVPGLEDRETCVAFRGKTAPESDGDAVAEAVAETLPMADFAPMDGGQAAVEWILGLV